MEKIQLINDLCKDGDIVHSGGNIGELLSELAKGLSQEALIWAFESDEVNFINAQAIINASELKGRVILKHAALGAYNGVGQLPTTAPGNLDEDCPADMRILRLDSAVPSDRHISVIHLDVESYEAIALKGAFKIIQRCKPIVIVRTQLRNSKFEATFVRTEEYRLAAPLEDGSYIFLPKEPDIGVEENGVGSPT